MSSTIRAKNPVLAVIFNSTVNFMLAYLFVAYAMNLVSILLTLSLGYSATLFYWGYTFSGSEWSNDEIMVVFFFGMLFSLALAILFERIYKMKRRKPNRMNLFYFWVYVIALTWFLGNVMVGSYFNFGIGAAFRALGIPFVIRILFAIIAAFLMLYLGYSAQNHVVVSANAYLVKLPAERIASFFKLQIIYPAIIGVLLIAAFKYPNTAHLNFLDFLTMATMSLFFIGLFFRHKSLRSLKFKRRKDSFKISLAPLAILLILIFLFRLVLMDGLKF